MEVLFGMKITNLAILFVILIIPFVILLDIKANNLNSLTLKKLEYNKKIDAAVDDGVHNLVELDSNREIVLNKESAIEQFYNTLYANFGMTDDFVKQEELKAFIPVILITDADGFFLSYSQEYKENGQTLIKQNWTDKIAYTYDDSKYQYEFYLNNYIKIQDKGTMEWEEGDRNDLKTKFPLSILADDKMFDEIRRRTIIGLLDTYMSFYINKHNAIASHFGIQYEFALPVIEKEDWYRTIDDISMLTVFQGYPYGAGTQDVYNRYSIGGSRINKDDAFYLEKEEKSGRIYYHKKSCTKLVERLLPYYGQKECVLEGAYPCLDCKP